MLITILAFFLILSILVLVHELGHFFVAKMFNIKVEEFGFGFPPRVWSKKIGETLYSFNLLPIGGFVKLYGEDEAGGGKLSLPVESSKYKVSSKKEILNTKYLIQNTDLDRAFFAKPIWQRILVVVAGVFMNFLLAVTLISFLFASYGAPVPGGDVVISEVSKNSPAEKAGLSRGDAVLEIDGVKIVSSKDLISITKEKLGEPITLKIKDQNSNLKSVTITPRKKYPPDQGPMGVAIGQKMVIKKYPWHEAPIVGTKEAIKTSVLILSGLGAVVSQIATTGSVPQGVAGPIGIAQLTGEFVDSGFYALLSFLALLSLNLAILNVLPIPALDGGRLFFILIEAVTRRRVHPRFEAYSHAIGIAVLLALIALITLHDLGRIISGQPIIPIE
ncbi:MAG: RIP metalloprotease RseP [Candidatus Levybacteria bacterium RIFOXYA1_FULL_41_10]|nr:MAG: Membrane-associated zinc metalloprotease [Candidatus Levybacteria bacterium GW2011_GWA1_39_34]KKR51293.1 MAG: Membrane-associated zinc metalloprotease [Candidatus Levybacteria bacterium GW2011_GWC1_40_19]KKR94621.1 MAG: Membrane-associated zinc metalloprotease [Candidatus Levybacteria bacterium GW2011_GWA2_41_15]KKS00723.1 MAG: Membrane-associated zinc metalloprotease [Candidatus Levybacteria bacterium GW2011_GWB1_41_21]OGH20955.1 MAG: RIP metalloprotease RseP [Candidatus Levybacteria b